MRGDSCLAELRAELDDCGRESRPALDDRSRDLERSRGLSPPELRSRLENLRPRSPSRGLCCPSRRSFLLLMDSGGLDLSHRDESLSRRLACDLSGDGAFTERTVVVRGTLLRALAYWATS